MNLLLIRPVEVLSPQIIRITGDRARHLRDVLKVSVGSRLRVGIPNGPQGQGVVKSVEADILIQHDLDGKSPPESSCGSDIHLILAMPRPRVLGRILSHVASLGVSSLTLCRSWHVEKSYLASDILNKERLKEHLLDGLEQARLTRVPQVNVFPLFRPFVEDRLDELLPRGSRWLLHPESGQGMAEVQVTRDQPLVLAIGPERGWTPFECDLLEERGFERVHLGAAILRVETALVTAIAQARLRQCLA